MGAASRASAVCAAPLSCRFPDSGLALRRRPHCPPAHPLDRLPPAVQVVDETLGDLAPVDGPFALDLGHKSCRQFDLALLAAAAAAAAAGGGGGGGQGSKAKTRRSTTLGRDSELVQQYGEYYQVEKTRMGAALVGGAAGKGVVGKMLGTMTARSVFKVWQKPRALPPKTTVKP